MTNSNQHSRLNSSIPKQNLLDSFDQDSLIEWFSKNGKYAAYIFLGLIAFLIVVYRLSNSSTTQAEIDYLQAGKEFAAFESADFQKNPPAADEALKSLNSIMSSRTELHAAYDGAIAQILLNRAQVTEAKPYAQATLKRTQPNDLPLYGDFAATTLLISEKKYPEALETAQALKHKMLDEIKASPAQNDRTFGDMLFAFNLLRIAMLQQQVGNAKAELQTWQEWKHYAGLDKISKETISPQAFRILIQQLAIGSIALPDYIAYRESLLKK